MPVLARMGCMVGDSSVVHAAAAGEAVARPLRNRSLVAEELPQRLTPEFAINPRNTMPSTPPASWSRAEIYDALLRVRSLSHRGLVEPVLKRAKRVAEGGLESAARELTAPDRLAKLVGEEAKKEEE